MSITVNVHHYFHNDPKTDNVLQEISKKLDLLIERGNDADELRALAKDLKEGNTALKDAIEKNKQA